MEIIAPAMVTVALGSALLYFRAKWSIAARAEFIRSYKLPIGLYEKLREKRPTLTPKDCQLVGQALRFFFLAYLKSKRDFVSMPSQLADDLWHEFILYTKQYDSFCKQAFGEFMHHSPAVVLSSNRKSNAGLRRVWWYACKEENINPSRPTRLPLLFALDAKLNIADGFRYTTDCKGVSREGSRDGRNTIIYCGGDFASSSIDGTTTGFGDSTSFDTADSGGHGHSHGCGGHGGDGGCGGGGCGGGD